MSNSGVRMIVIGATNSTLGILMGLVRNGANVVGVYTLDPSVSEKVSGYSTPEILEFSRSHGIYCRTFRQINSPDIVSDIRNLRPDILFPVGFSQLVGKELLSIPSRGSLGFHPTRLPLGRGRAPLAWVTHDCGGGAATFFVMGEGADDGPIVDQEFFEVEADDHAADVEAKCMAAMDLILDRMIPLLLQGVWNAEPQLESEASYNGIRRPSDGLISWTASSLQTYAQIRASSRPHPGAYTYFQDRKIIIWRAAIERHMRWRGVPGRVLMICPERGALVQAGGGLLWLKEMEDPNRPQEAVVLKVGMRLGYVTDEKIFELIQSIATMQTRLDQLQQTMEKFQ